MIAIDGEPQLDVKALQKVKLVLLGGKVAFDEMWRDQDEVGE
jgi:hypothetical protein